MGDLSIQKGFERLKIIKPDFSYQKWYFTKVLDKTDIENREFYTDSYKLITIDLLNAKKINGTFHIDYNNKMWIEMLGTLTRFDSDKYFNFDSIMDFVSTSSQGKNLNKFGDYYLIGEGNHRFCLAKFLCIDLREVSVTEYEFNDKYYSKYNELKKRNFLIQEKSGSFWTLKFDGYIVKINENLIMDFIKMYDEIQIRVSFFEKTYKKDNYVVSYYSDLNSKAITEIIKAHKKIKYD